MKSNKMKLVKIAEREREICKCDFRSPRGKCWTMCFALSFRSLLLDRLPCPAETLHESFDTSIPRAPIPVAVANKQEFVSEVHLTNFSSDDLLLHFSTVFEESSQAEPQTFLAAGRDAATTLKPAPPLQPRRPNLGLDKLSLVDGVAGRQWAPRCDQPRIWSDVYA
jgi:hypothetical protein